MTIIGDRLVILYCDVFYLANELNASIKAIDNFLKLKPVYTKLR